EVKLHGNINAFDVNIESVLCTLDGKVNANNVSLAASQSLWISPSSVMHLGGSFDQTGLGYVQMGGSIYAKGSVHLEGALALLSDMQIKGGKSVVFDRAIDGNHGLYVAGEEI